MPHDFASLPVSPALRSVGQELGYDTLTPIQVASIPVLLAGKDLLGQSRTGSGKTVAFALPVLERLDLRALHPQALVLCPTRELCAQIAGEFRKLARKLDGVRVLSVVGGEPMREQTSKLERGVHVVVGTPGRLADHLHRGTLDPRAITTVILDEADRMLDMGFGPDVERILAVMPRRRQTVLLSATLPPTIEALAGRYLRDPVRVQIEGEPEAAQEIRQLVLAAEPTQKLHALCWVLGAYPNESALVFCNLKATVAELTATLSAGGVSVDCLHGDMEQFFRDQVMARFRNSSIRVLIATDVAARGIDVEDLDLVVNYELPSPCELYVHRIGRTGRAGKTGLAVTLASAREHDKLVAFERLTGVPMERVRQPLGGHNEAKAALKSAARAAPMDTILISGGRKDKLRKADVLGALTGEAGGIEASDVGRIELQDRLTYVAVSRAVSREVLARLNRGRIKGKRFRATLTGR